jgi:hypothetical protein
VSKWPCGHVDAGRPGPAVRPQEDACQLDELVTHRLTLEQINNGFELMKSSRSIGAIVVQQR